MKNFFKKLAFVLALAMIVTAIAPAAQASAATGPAFKYTKKTLYIGGDLTGKYEDNYRFTFTNAKGYTATWKSSKPSVATIDAKTGEIQAVAVGTATIKATLKNKAGNVVETTAKVYVKQNAEKVGFGTTASVKDMAIGDTGKVNVYRQVGTSKVWKQSEKTLITDVIKWKSSDLEVATVDKWGKVTAIGAGEAIITATATQSEGSVAGASKTFKVTVKSGLTDAKQASKNTINATFAGDLSAVANKENVKVYSLVGTTKVNVLVKAVDFDKTDKTKAVITTYADLVKGTDYVVEYAETSASFKGADLSKDSVARIEITTTKATKGELTPVEVKGYTESGVELPATSVEPYITLSAESSNKYFLDGENITIYNTGDTAVITATFHTYTYDNDYKEIVKTYVGTVTAVDEIVSEVKGVDVFTVYDNTKNPDFTKPTASLSLSDASGKYSVAVQVKDNKNTTIKSNVDFTNFRFESSDETKLIINGSVLFPLKEGNVTVIVWYKDAAIGAYTVNIGPARAVANVIPKLDKSKLSINGAADSIVLDVEVLDQYKANNAADVTVEYVTGPVVKADAPQAVEVTNNQYIFNTGSELFDTAGKYQYVVKAGNISRAITFEVADVSKKTEAYVQLTNAGKTVDTALKVDGDTAYVGFDMELIGYTADGYKKNLHTLYASKTAAESASASNARAEYYVEFTAPSGVDLADFAENLKVDTGAVAVEPIVIDTTVSKLPVGTYRVQVFKVESGKTPIAVTAANFTITDTQTAASVKVLNTISTKLTLESLLVDPTDIVEIKLNDKIVNGDIVTTGDITSYYVGTPTTGNTFFLKQVVIEVEVNYLADATTTTATPGTLLQKVAIGTNVTLK